MMMSAWSSYLGHVAKMGVLERAGEGEVEERQAEQTA